MGKTTAVPKAMAVLFKQVREGDIRKLAAQSNDAPTGGGARDLRFPAEPFAPVLHLFFPDVVGTSSNGGEIRKGTLAWVNASGVERFPVELHPPTDARPTEARIARINDLEPLQECPDPDDNDPVFVIFTLDGDRSFRCDFATTSDLHLKWHPDIASPMLRSLDVIRGKKSACGYINLISGMEYLHQ
jgi:hypothetical protein